MTMAPQTKSIVNINTVDPGILSRVPAYMHNGAPSDKHVLRLKSVTGPGGNVCLLLYGTVVDSYLRNPGEVANSRVVRQRGIVLSAYKPTFKRISALYAHVKGEKETFMYPYGQSHVALTQSPEAVATGGSNFDSDPESGSESKDAVKVNVKDAMRRPLFSQDPRSKQDFSFKSTTNLLFDQKGKPCLMVLKVYLCTNQT